MDEKRYQVPLVKRAIYSREATGVCFGTFGELLQGVLPDQGGRFLVTLPIARYSTVRYVVMPQSTDLFVFPRGKSKVYRLAQMLLDYFQIDKGGVLNVQSELLEGKGCASSSADMVAAARAICRAYRVELAPATLAAMMAEIEPSDGVMYHGIVSFYHCKGILRKWLGHVPRLTIVAVDEGGQVDTVVFNKRLDVSAPEVLLRYECLLHAMEEAVINGDLATIGEIATQSALLNQQILPKAYLDLMLDLSRQYDALGVVVSHSGTCIGLLFDPFHPDYARKLTGLLDRLACYNLTIEVFYTHQTSEEMPRYVF